MAQKNVKEVAKAGLAELAKRVPPNQSLQFQAFQAKHIEYQTRVNKQPEKLPSIDWDFYRLNVRPESQKWVDEFKQKYKALCDSFDARAKQDYSKYYTELEQVRCEMQEEIEKYKCESNERIKALQAEYDSIKALKPYDEMTLEEYCDTLPEKKMYTHEGRPSFWPHTLDEQSLEPPMKHGHDDHGDGGGHGKPPKDDGGAAGGAAGGASGGSTSTKGSESKDDPAKSKPDEKSAKSAKTTNIVQSESATATKPKKSVTFKDAEELKKKTLASKLVEEEIERALIYAPFEDPELKERQAVIGKK